MAKNIHWQIGFASAIDKKQYRVDIYQEGYTGSPVTLLAGSSPFNTEEDNNPDLFTPIRTQSGTLQVCTAIPGGGLLKVQDILPSNNTDCPVQLIEMEDGEEYIVWQGFLSCEAYSQDYIGIAQELSLSLISVLEAMDSVECDPEQLTGVVPIHNLIGYLFDEMERKVQNGHIFSRIYIGEQGKAFLHDFINTSLFFDVQEQNDEGYNEAILKGISLKEVLTKLATFMGWCIRESAKAIYIQTAGADNDWVSGTVSEMIEDQWTPTKSYVTNALKNMSDLEWRGTGHRINSHQGARNVEVVANMTPFDIQVGIPDGFPQGEYITAENTVTIPTDEEGVTAEATVYISKQNDLNNRYEFQYFEIIDDNLPPYFWFVDGTLQYMYEHSYYGGFGSPSGTGDYAVGAACVQITNKDEEFNLYGVFVMGTTLTDNFIELKNGDYILNLRSINHLNAYNGKFLLDFECVTTLVEEVNEGYSIFVAIKWGDKFLQNDKRTWSSNFAFVQITQKEEIPINEYNYGEVQLQLMPISLYIPNGDLQPGHLSQYILKSLSLEYQAPEDVFEDRGANHYFEALKTAFRDEVSVECDFGSSLDNLPNPSLILDIDPNRYYEPLTRMTFYDGMQVEERPEKHLLSRLTTYYRKPHASLELVAAFPGVLPMMRYRGLNDGKFYLPMAASRDWQQDTATLSMLQCEPYWRVYRWDDNVWDKENDYVSIVGAGNSRTIYISSDTDLHWADRDFHLQSVYVNGVNGYGTIQAGNKVAVGIYLDDDNNEEGWLDFYRDTTLVFSIYVKAISN